MSKKNIPRQKSDRSVEQVGKKKHYKEQDNLKKNKISKFGTPLQGIV